MTVVFRSCLSQFYSNPNQSISDECLSHKTTSMECLSIISNQNLTTNPQLNSSSYQEIFEDKQSKQISPLKTTKKRGPRYSRIQEQSPPLLTRLIGTIFGDYGSTIQKKSRPKKTLLPSKSTIKKQFEENEQTLHSLITLLTQIESNVTTKNDNQSMEKEQARNNNRMDDTSSSYSNDNYHQKSKISKRSTKNHLNNKKRQAENDTLSSSSHYSSQSRRKMIDNQQQTPLYPTKTHIETSTQSQDQTASDSSWFDLMREDQTTINAWARIRRRLKPNQQKDILRALMIICANLFDVPLENKHI